MTHYQREPDFDLIAEVMPESKFMMRVNGNALHIYPCEQQACDGFEKASFAGDHAVLWHLCEMSGEWEFWKETGEPS